MAAQLAAAAPAELQRLRSEAATLRERVGALSTVKVRPISSQHHLDAGLGIRASCNWSEKA